MKFFKKKKSVTAIGQLVDLSMSDFKKYLKETQNLDLNENSIFDIQIKRLHEYKRQQMNVLYIINKYLEE